MQLRLTAAVLAAVLVWPVATRVADADPPASQSDSHGTPATQHSATAIFDRAWKLGFPSAGSGEPYILKAVFTARGKSGEVTTGTYTDTWVSNKQWRREADFGKSQFIRSRNGKRRYRLDEGPDAALLQFVLTAMEPLPSIDSVRDSDWQVKPVQVDGSAEIRVANGHENRDGTPDPKDFNGFWFDESGQLVKTLNDGLETRRLKFADFNGLKIARVIQVMTKGMVGMQIEVTQLAPAGPVDTHIFTIKHHGWDGPDTDQMR
jgi:hypothetical protein